MKALQLGHCLVRHLVAERAHVHGEALGVARVLGQPVEPLYVHAAAPRAGDPPALELEVDPPAGHREVVGPAGPLVVAAATAPTALRAHYVKGADQIQTHQAESGTKRAFCRTCGSTLACFVDNDDLVEITAATLDTPVDLRPEYHIYARSKVSWFDIKDGKPRHQTTSGQRD